jgi:hypothetical protein
MHESMARSAGVKGSFIGGDCHSILPNISRRLRLTIANSALIVGIRGERLDGGAGGIEIALRFPTNSSSFSPQPLAPLADAVRESSCPIHSNPVSSALSRSGPADHLVEHRHTSARCRWAIRMCKLFRLSPNVG